MVSGAVAAPVSGPQPGDQRVEEERARERAARQSANTAAERERRVASRRAYRALSRSEALELAKARHPEFVLLPAWRAFVVPAGHDVAGYENDFVARIATRDGSAGQLVSSNVPLRAPGSDGQKRPVDLSLAGDGAAFAAVNPLADIRLSKRLSDGLRLTDSGLVARPVVDAEQDPVLSADTLFYANVLTDADVLVQPTVDGFAVHTQLRSEDSPERLILRLDAPPGATLHENRGEGRIEVRRGDETVAGVMAPAAADADGRPVELSWRLDDSRLVIDVPHRGRDLAYPLMVDPDVVETFEWERYGVDRGYGNIAGWTYGSSGNFAGLAWAGNSTWLGNGLYIRNLQWGMGTSALYFDAGNAGWWTFTAPGLARLNRVEWNLFDQDYVDGTCTELGINGPGGWRPGNPSWNHCGVYYNQYVNSWGSGEPGDSATFKLQAVTSGHKPYFASQVGVVYLYMSDPDVPVLGSGLPDGWVNWAPSEKLDVWALDVSLGIRELTLSSGQWSRTIGPDHYTRCKRTYVCPRGHATDGDSYPVTLEGLPEGINDLAVTATDPAGNAWRSDQVARLSGQGLRGQYYDNADFTAGTFARLDPEVNFDWGGGSPDSRIGADTFAVRWSGYVQAPDTGTYTFETSTDDGVRLWVRDLNSPIIDDWRQHGETARNGTISLEAGKKYRIVMEYFEEGGGAVARLRWKPPSAASFVTIPANRLSPPGGWQLKLDRSSPTLSVTGRLREFSGRAISEAAYAMRAVATDGSASSRSTERSGVKRLQVFVDGQLKAGAASDCPAGNCEKSVQYELRAQDFEDGWHTIRVEASDQVGNAPTVEQWQVYVDHGNGALEHFSFIDDAVTENTAAHVNVGNGNFLFRARDFEGGSTGPSLTLARSYNSRTARLRSGPLGNGWTADNGADVRLAARPDGTVRFTGPSGYAATFEPSVGGYSRPRGLSAALTRLDNGAYDLDFFDLGEVYRFNSTGRLESILEEDAGRVYFEYDGAGRTTRTRNDDGDEITFTYNAAGRVASARTAAGEHRFTYSDAGNLVSHTNAAQQTTTYSYDALNRLVEVAPVGNHKLKVTYDGRGQVTTLRRITDPSRDSGPTTSFTFGAGSATVTPPDNIIQTHRHDDTLFVNHASVGSGPSLTPSGTLHQRAEQQLDRGTVYDLTVRATDGDAGVDSLDVNIDGGTELAVDDACSGSCATSRSVDVDASNYESGEHIVEGFADDDNRRWEKRRFIVRRPSSVRQQHAKWRAGSGSEHALSTIPQRLRPPE